MSSQVFRTQIVRGFTPIPSVLLASEVPRQTSHCPASCTWQIPDLPNNRVTDRRKGGLKMAKNTTTTKIPPKWTKLYTFLATPLLYPDKNQHHSAFQQTYALRDSEILALGGGTSFCKFRRNNLAEREVPYCWN